MNKKSIFSMMLFFVIVLGIGYTYSFYKPVITGNQSTPTTKLANKNIEVNYINGSDILIDSTHTSVTKNITIKNNNANTRYFSLEFEDVINTIGDKPKLTYSYTCTGTGCIGRSNIEVPSSDSSLTLLTTINSGITHTYEITFTYDGTPTGSFTSKINIIEPNSQIIISTNWSDTIFFWGYRSSITSVTFEEVIDVPAGAYASWDVSYKTDGSVMAYIIDDGLGTSTYELYIQGNGELYANPDSKYLFYNFSKITQINNSNLLKTHFVTSMLGMFYNCSSLASLDLSAFNTELVTTMHQMFYNCSSLASLDLSVFNTELVTTMQEMFRNCKSLTSLDLSSFNTVNVTRMDRMFYYCEKLTSLDLSSFNTSIVTLMQQMFYYCEKLTSLDLSSFYTPKVVTMEAMFYYCKELTSLDLSNFDTSIVTNMTSMFSTCQNITSLDLSNFNTSNVTSMNGMFIGCFRLTSVDLSSFNTSKVYTFQAMFSGCSALTNVDLSSFDTSDVTNMESMFSTCQNITSLDLSMFDTSNVNSMKNMFWVCTNLTSLDLSSFNTSKVTNMEAMFNWCNYLTTIYVSNSWVVTQVTNSTNMFTNCFLLVGAIKYNSTYRDKTHANYQTGYLTYKAYP